MVRVFVIFAVLVVVKAKSSTEASLKDQCCVDPRTMQKHAAYTEWADAYSCTRHRCQPGGRNLAIYTVGCKRVEAPESAIECEEVVEDTNMQFPYCCTRLRCLVVVRGEVWTRVLGQPWEVLPAAPWSHMYKRKKPPPGSEAAFLPKQGEGPVYELLEPSRDEGKAQLTRKSKGGEVEGCSDVRTRVNEPDIVIALTTDEQSKEPKKLVSGNKMVRHPRSRSAKKELEPRLDEEEANIEDYLERATELQPPVTEAVSEKRHFKKISDNTLMKPSRIQPNIPWNQWKEYEPMEAELQESTKQSQEYSSEQPVKERKDESGELPSSNLHALVQAIGKRMRDIEDVVQRMSEKVHKVQNPSTDREIETASDEKTSNVMYGANDLDLDIQHNEETKKPSPDDENNRSLRFSPQRGVKYVHMNDVTTTEPSLFAEDSNGYYSDASNSLLRREPKEPIRDTYIAPAENLSKPNNLNKKAPLEESTEKEKPDKKVHKKKMHKKKHSKGHHKKHLPKNEKRRKFNTNSKELDKNAISIEGISITTSRNNK